MTKLLKLILPNLSITRVLTVLCDNKFQGFEFSLRRRQVLDGSLDVFVRVHGILGPVELDKILLELDGFLQLGLPSSPPPFSSRRRRPLPLASSGPEAPLLVPSRCVRSHLVGTDSADIRSIPASAHNSACCSGCKSTAVLPADFVVDANLSQKAEAHKEVRNPQFSN